MSELSVFIGLSLVLLCVCLVLWVFLVEERALTRAYRQKWYEELDTNAKLLSANTALYEKVLKVRAALMGGRP